MWVHMDVEPILQSNINVMCVLSLLTNQDVQGETMLPWVHHLAHSVSSIRASDSCILQHIKNVSVTGTQVYH